MEIKAGTVVVVGKHNHKIYMVTIREILRFVQGRGAVCGTVEGNIIFIEPFVDGATPFGRVTFIMTQEELDGLQ